MKKIFTVSLIFMLLGACTSHQTKTPEDTLYEKVMTAIRTQNASTLSDAEYDKIEYYISQGKNSWLDLYPKLGDEPFLGVTAFQEGLNISMAYALPVNPTETLKFINKSNVDEICGLTFIEPTTNEIYLYYLRARAALLVHGARSPLGANCLAVLDSTMYDIKQFHRNTN
ncbi:TPA: hypothetical protein ACIPUI_001315 [Citrobacter freundii]